VNAPRRCRLAPRIEEREGWIAFARRPLGQAAVLAAFAAGLFALGRAWWLEMGVALAALSAFPRRRRELIVLATAYWWWRYTPLEWEAVVEVARREGVAERIDFRLLRAAAIVAALAFCAGYLRVARAGRTFAPLRRPIATLLALYVALLAAAWYAPLPGFARCAAWAFLVVLGRCLWFLAYSLLRTDAPGSTWLEVGRFVPFWQGAATTPIPFPKAAAYLDRIEVKDARERALWQLKGLMLLAWTGVLVASRKALHWAELPIPELAVALEDALAGRSRGALSNWLSLLDGFASTLLDLAIWGHVIVACCRMAGFKALRNTYRPLSSTSIAEFWNRYYFYFKELLVDVFFYPAFVRYFRGHPRLRRAFATLAAASFGNFLLHYLRDVEMVASSGPLAALFAKRSYAVYAVLLGVAIALSQLRAPSRAGAARRWWDERLLAPAAVVGFFCLLQVFEVESGATLRDRFAFLRTLAGLEAR
jgi:hypothetical protein